MARDVSGQRFGRLIALRPTDQRKGSQIVWECRCDCGNTAFVGVSNLTRGNTNSCGCLHSEWAKENGQKARRDIAGQRFGMLIAIRPTEMRQHRAVVWECVCDCGNVAFASLRNLQGGDTQSCGCLYRIRAARHETSNEKE